MLEFLGRQISEKENKNSINPISKGKQPIIFKYIILFSMSCSSLALAPAKLLYVTYCLWKEGAISASEKTKAKCKIA